MAQMAEDMTPPVGTAAYPSDAGRRWMRREIQKRWGSTAAFLRGNSEVAVLRFQVGVRADSGEFICYGMGPSWAHAVRDADVRLEIVKRTESSVADLFRRLE